MSIAQSITSALNLPKMVVDGYLEDLSNEELLVRPVEGCNHIAWQLGHLITAEHGLLEQVCPGKMPPLPEGFAEKYTKETSQLDDPAAFHTKAEYLEAMQQQRAGTLAILAEASDEQLNQPAPESLHYFGRTVGDIIAGQITHWMMHAGQWAVVRRKLGRPPLF